MFFKDFTPLLRPPNQIRAGRIYPGGRNLDMLIVKKTNPEEGWHYPEAWIFSPNNPAINYGSQRKEGETFFYDSEGNLYNWNDYVKLHPEVLGDKKLNLCVKLLDSDCTLPKELHFREEDIQKLRNYPLLKEFTGTFIKPEVWIRHPSAKDISSPSFIGFNRKLTQKEFYQIVNEGIEDMEKNMNLISLNKGESLYISGGTVHSLGKGLYFEVLAAGDLKVTLQGEFAGRKLSIEEQLDQVYTEDEKTFYNALGFVDYSRYGKRVVEEALRKPKTGKIVNIITNKYFSADWINLHPMEKLSLQGNAPHILVVVNGHGKISSASSELSLQTRE